MNFIGQGLSLGDAIKVPWYGYWILNIGGPGKKKPLQPALSLLRTHKFSVPQHHWMIIERYIDKKNRSNNRRDNFFNLRRALATACCKGAGAQLYVWLAPLKTAFGLNHRWQATLCSFNLWSLCRVWWPFWAAAIVEDSERNQASNLQRLTTWKILRWGSCPGTRGQVEPRKLRCRCSHLWIEFCQADMLTSVLQPGVDLVTEHDHLEPPEHLDKCLELVSCVRTAWRIARIGQDEKVGPRQAFEALLYCCWTQLPALVLRLLQKF